MPGKKLRDALSSRLGPWMERGLFRHRVSSPPERIPRARARRVVVLAPHPGDDVIGCGGTLCKHRRAGDDVTVIYLTNGEQENNHAAPPCTETAEKRRREAEQAGGVLGIRDLVFLDFTDGELSSGPEIVERLCLELERAAPEAVFLPFLLDAHPDHRAANRAFASAVNRWKDRMDVYAYEVRTPLPANRLVDITPVAGDKEKAIRMYVSRSRQKNYAEAALGLNRYRSLPVSSGKGFCEAFFCLDAPRYASLVRETLGNGKRR